MKKIRLLDAFAGIGGFHLGVQQACAELGIDFECVGAIEIDKKAQQTYLANHKINGQMYSDITKIDIESLPDHDILTGGFPCQPFSRARHNRKDSAGIQAVDGDDRVNLFTYLCAILKTKQPSFFIFENVAALQSEKNIDGDYFINDIVRGIKDAGYTVSYSVLSPHMFDVPQKRERVFFIGHRLDIDKKLQFPASIGNTRIIADILEASVDSKYLLSNLWQNIKNHKLANRFSNRYEAILDAYKNGKWKDSKDKNTEKPVTAARVEGDTPSGNSRQRDRVFSSLGISPTLIASTPISIADESTKTLRQLTPREEARIQGFPDTFNLHPSDGLAYKQIGNAVCPIIVKYIMKGMIGGN